jgi:hypothetical protein
MEENPGDNSPHGGPKGIGPESPSPEAGQNDSNSLDKNKNPQSSSTFSKTRALTKTSVASPNVDSKDSKSKIEPKSTRSMVKTNPVPPSTPKAGKTGVEGKVTPRSESTPIPKARKPTEIEEEMDDKTQMMHYEDDLESVFLSIAESDREESDHDSQEDSKESQSDHQSAIEKNKLLKEIFESLKLKREQAAIHEQEARLAFEKNSEKVARLKSLATTHIITQKRKAKELAAQEELLNSVYERVKRLKTETETRFIVDGEELDPTSLVDKLPEEEDSISIKDEYSQQGGARAVDESTTRTGRVAVTPQQAPTTLPTFDRPGSSSTNATGDVETNPGHVGYIHMTRRERALFVKERDEKRRQERRERNADRSVYSQSPDTDEERRTHLDANTISRNAARELRKELSHLVVNGVEIKTFDRDKVPITTLLLSIKHLFEGYSEDMSSKKFLQEISVRLFSQLDQVWITHFLDTHEDPSWEEIEREFIQFFRATDSGMSSATKYATMVKKPLWEESVQDWFAKNQTYSSTMRQINPAFASDNMYMAMSTQILNGKALDRSGSLERLSQIFIEEWLGGRANEMLPKLYLAEMTWLTANPKPLPKAKVATTGGWDDIAVWPESGSTQEPQNEARDSRDRTRVNESSARDNYRGEHRKEGRQRPFCDFCKRPGHHVDGCWNKDPSKRPKSWGKRPIDNDRSVEKVHTDAAVAHSFGISSKDEIADQYKVDQCDIHRVDPVVIIWDSGSQVNWLSKQAVNDWKSVEKFCKPTTIRIYTVDEVHTGSKPIGILKLPIVWAGAKMDLTFVVMNDSSKKVIFGAPVLKNFIKGICLETMSMTTWAGHKVPFSEMDEKTPIPRVCSILRGAEVKWRVVGSSIALPDAPSTITLEPEVEALDYLPERILFDTKLVKPLGDKGVIVDMNTLSTKQGTLVVSVSSASAFAKELTEGMSLLTSTIKPGNLTSA